MGLCFETHTHRYEKSHWDNAIHDYRETEKNAWAGNNPEIIERLRRTAFSEGSTTPLSHTHILDLSAQGTKHSRMRFLCYDAEVGYF